KRVSTAGGVPACRLSPHRWWANPRTFQQSSNQVLVAALPFAVSMAGNLRAESSRCYDCHMSIPDLTRFNLSAAGGAVLMLLVLLPVEAQVSFGSRSTTSGRSVGTATGGSRFSAGNAFVHPRFGNVVTGRSVGTTTGETPAYHG